MGGMHLSENFRKPGESGSSKELI